MATSGGSPLDERHRHEEWLASLAPSERAALLHRVMVRQARLSAGIAAVFLTLLLGLPLVNWLLPDLASLNVGGFTLTWLVLGIVFYPITWGLSSLFIRRSNDLESEIAHSERPGGGEVR